MSALVGRDGRQYPIGESRWRGDDGSPLMVTAQPGLGVADVDASVRSQWRYTRALPIALPAVSLGEGCTPMLDLTLPTMRVQAKLEWLNPTGSFKDRGSSVMVSVLAQQGVVAILEDSSGNGGASVAAYAAAAGIDTKVLVPESATDEKILQTRIHGATLERVRGDRQATAEEAVRQSEERFYASHNWHPFFIQGVKLIAYEIWENLGFRAPDAVVVPAGAGSLVLGCAVGFSELVRSGEIPRVPRLLVSQPVNCSPLARAFEAGEAAVTTGRWSATIAEGTAIARPVRDREVLAAVRDCGGDIVAVSEDSIVAAVRELAGRGLYVEPTSASVVAAIPDFLRRGTLHPSELAVAVLSGTGLKSSATMARIADGFPDGR